LLGLLLVTAISLFVILQIFDDARWRDFFFWTARLHVCKTVCMWYSSELWWLSGGKREDYQNCSVLYCVLKVVHSHISTLRWAVLTVLWIGFCLTGPISLCLDSFMFMFVFLCYLVILHMCCIIVTRWGGYGAWDWSLILRTFLQCFDTVGWVIWPVKPVPDMTYNAFGGTLNLTQLNSTYSRTNSALAAVYLLRSWCSLKLTAYSTGRSRGV